MMSAERGRPFKTNLNRATPAVNAKRRSRLPRAALDRGPITFPGVGAYGDLEVYTWEGVNQKGIPYFAGAAFIGNQGKELWHHHFRTSEARDEFVVKTMKSQRAISKIKAERTEKRKHFRMPEVGEVFVASWGYDQTNVDFYQVIATRGAVVDVQKIGKRLDHEEKGGTSFVVPDPDRRGAILKSKRPSGYEGRPLIKIDDVRTARPWDGRPEYESSGYAGH